MNIRKHSDLRSLALAYYWGWMPREKYLALRKEYLKSITAGKQPKEITPQELAPPKKKAVSVQDIESGSNTTSPKVLVTLTLIVLMAIAGVLIFGTGNDDNKKTIEASSSGESLKSSSIHEDKL